jgi:predicted nicotinamide N-methyase
LSSTSPPPSSGLQRQAAHLRYRIHKRFETITQALRIGSLEIEFTRIREPDSVLDQVVEEEDRRERVTGQRRSGDELHLPYWAELWDSAFGLGAHLVGQAIQSPRPQPLDILDLGCGMGLAGTVAAALDHRVLLADLEAPALLFARLNTLRWSDRARVRQLDWRRDRLDEQFDLILGSDVLYERKQWDFLEPFWRSHLRSGGRVLVGEPGRQTGDMFLEWIVARGWKLRSHERRVATRERPIRIFELSM